MTELSVEHPPESGSGSHDHDARLDVMAARAQLTPKQRTVLVLRYLEDLTEVQTGIRQALPYVGRARLLLLLIGVALAQRRRPGVR